jgi:hypothetical protein
MAKNKSLSIGIPTALVALLMGAIFGVVWTILRPNVKLSALTWLLDFSLYAVFICTALFVTILAVNHNGYIQRIRTGAMAIRYASAALILGAVLYFILNPMATANVVQHGDEFLINYGRFRGWIPCDVDQFLVGAFARIQGNFVACIMFLAGAFSMTCEDWKRKKE